MTTITTVDSDFLFDEVNYGRHPCTTAAAYNVFTERTYNKINRGRCHTHCCLATTSGRNFGIQHTIFEIDRKTKMMSLLSCLYRGEPLVSRPTFVLYFNK